MARLLDSRHLEDFLMRLSMVGLSFGLCALFLSGTLDGRTATAATAATMEGWTLDKQENGIEVYTRPVEGSGIKEFKGLAEVDVSVEKVLALLRDSNRFKTWFPNTPESKLLARDGDVSYQYSVMGTPWPMDDRDNVLRSVTTRNESTGVVGIEVTAAPDYYPVQKDRHRVQKAHGTWTLEPDSPDKTHVTFIMHLEPGGGIPQWMINARIVATPFEALTNLRATVGD
jgi:hypothetical protein